MTFFEFMFIWCSPIFLILITIAFAGLSNRIYQLENKLKEIEEMVGE